MASCDDASDCITSSCCQPSVGDASDDSESALDIPTEMTNTAHPLSPTPTIDAAEPSILTFSESKPLHSPESLLLTNMALIGVCAFLLLLLLALLWFRRTKVKIPDQETATVNHKPIKSFAMIQSSIHSIASPILPVRSLDSHSKRYSSYSEQHSISSYSQFSFAVSPSNLIAIRLNRSSITSFASIVTNSSSILIDAFMSKIHPLLKETTFNLHEFTSACQTHSPQFSTSAFFNDFPASSPSLVTPINTLDQFSRSGLTDPTTSQCSTLVTTLFASLPHGLEILDHIRHHATLGLHNPHHLIHYYQVYLPLTRQFFSTLDNISECIMFDVRGFENACLLISSEFKLRLFMTQLIASQYITHEWTASTLKTLGITAESDVYTSLMTALCGDYDSTLFVLKEWRKVLVEYGMEGFLKID